MGTPFRKGTARLSAGLRAPRQTARPVGGGDFAGKELCNEGGTEVKKGGGRRFTPSPKEKARAGKGRKRVTAFTNLPSSGRRCRCLEGYLPVRKGGQWWIEGKGHHYKKKRTHEAGPLRSVQMGGSRKLGGGEKAGRRGYGPGIRDGGETKSRSKKKKERREKGEPSLWKKK